jgi:hypothetical protein
MEVVAKKLTHAPWIRKTYICIKHFSKSLKVSISHAGIHSSPVLMLILRAPSVTRTGVVTVMTRLSGEN